MTAAFAVPFSARRLGLAAAYALILVLAGATPISIGAARAADAPPASTTHTDLINAADGLAIKGYDPVAYFTEGRPVMGNPEIRADLDGATWQFTTVEHRDAFLAHPTRYEPEYGGFCAYGAAQGLKTDIDPAAFSIIGGRLYLNASMNVRTLWRNELIMSIARADRNWAEVKDQPILR